MLKDREQNRARKSKTNGLHLDFTGMIPQKNLSAPHKEKSQSKWWHIEERYVIQGNIAGPDGILF